MLTLYSDGIKSLIRARNKVDGDILEANMPQLIAAIVQLAEQDKNVRAYLLAMTVNSAYANVIVILVFGIIIPILANHGMLPPLLMPQQPNPDAVPSQMEVTQSDGYTFRQPI